MIYLESKARAFVYGGDWVADCPQDGCSNVEFLCDKNPSHGNRRTADKPQFFCSYCKHVAPIEWPANRSEIMGVLDLRPIPHTRNWYPKGHPTAIAWRLPDGQSVEDLRDENEQHGVRSK